MVYSHHGWAGGHHCRTPCQITAIAQVCCVAQNTETRAGLSQSAALFQLSSPPFFLFSSSSPLSVPLPPFLLPPPPRPEAATPPSLSLLLLPPLLFPFRPSMSLRSKTPYKAYIQLGGMGKRCELPSGVWGGAPAEIEFGAF